MSTTSTHIRSTATLVAGEQVGLVTRVWLAALVGTSFVVLFEPAPTDMLFAVGFPFLALTGNIRLISMSNPLAYAGLFLLLLGSLVSMFFCRDVVAAGKFFGITVYLLLMFVAISSLIARQGVRVVEIIIRAYLFAAAAASAVGILAYMRVIPNYAIFFRDDSMIRIRSTFKDPNVFSPFVVAAIVLIAARVIKNRHISLTELGLTLLYLIAILVAFSRGAVIHLFFSLSLVIAGYLLAFRRIDYLIKSLIVAVPTVFIASGALYLVMQSTDAGSYLTGRVSLQKYDQERFAAQGAALRTMSDKPLGIGPGQWNPERKRVATHNLYLLVAAENGILGVSGLILFFCGWIWTVCTDILRRAPHLEIHLACLAIVGGILLESVVIDTLHWRHFFLFLAIPPGLSAFAVAHQRVTASALAPYRPPAAT